MSSRSFALNATEPASAASVAGILTHGLPGDPAPSTVVCVLTGHGLKDPDTAIAQSVQPLTVDAELAAIEQVIRSRSQ